ncbi:hypothetical protein ABT352_33055 [Streptosporangium sp. NPDC000563]|uniref:hypothetical protein n=1 Tax=Streptosporangium sp. NPDC000563 TaxID=3154366 RepID=UPI0033331C0B
MSSIYRVLCLSHDPAITAEAEYDRPEYAATAIASGIPEHADCDLLIGRYSYPLVEVGCPPTTGPEHAARHRCYPHSVTEWVDVAWLRLLAAVHQSGAESMWSLTGNARLAHWSRERLHRLRNELGIDAGAPADQTTGQSGATQ